MVITNKRNSVLYAGVTNNLIRRFYEHKNRLISGFSCKYNLNKLVYYAVYDNALAAITREKQLKKWNKKWKIELIEKLNPEWNDLYSTL